MLNWLRATFFPHRTHEGVGSEYWAARVRKAKVADRTIVVGFRAPDRVMMDIEHRALGVLRMHDAYAMEPIEAKRLIRELARAVEAVEKN